jgi:hypothetical protein
MNTIAKNVDASLNIWRYPLKILRPNALPVAVIRSKNCFQPAL